MMALRDDDHAIDPLTLAAEASCDPADIDELAGCAPAAGNFRDYGRLVLDCAAWRARQTAVHGLQLAVNERDDSAFEQAEALIARADRPDDTTSDSQQLASDMFDWLGHEDTDAIPLPFETLNRALSGGLRRGDVTLVCGWSSMGKSVLVDGILEHAACGHRAHLYINEMSRRDRFARRLARYSSVRFSRILERQRLTKSDHAELLRAMSAVPTVGISDCSGWSGHDIARHIRRHRWDIAAVDLLNLIPHDGPERSRVGQVDAISAALNGAARQADCHLLIVCQLNQERNKGAKLPRPVRRDIRESGQLANDAANVLFVHREQVPVEGGGADMFELLNDGSVWLDKARNGQLGGEAVTLNASRMMFVPGASSRDREIAPDWAVAG